MTSKMTCDRVAELLPDWLEGDRGSALLEVSRHLDSCAECRTLAEDLQRIILAAGSLPVREPQSDLWPGIAGRVSGSRAHGAAQRLAPSVSVAEQGVLSIGDGRSRLRRWRAPLAAAAAVLVVALGALLVQGSNPLAESAGAGNVAIEASDSGATLVSTAASVPLGGMELLAESYGGEIAAMSELLATRRSVLDTATVAVLERNLEIIDAAIAESREALERDPASALLTDQLNTAYGLKLDVMRRAVLLTSGA